MCVRDETAVVNDKRAHPRFEARLQGRLLSPDGRCNYSCVVLDVSEGGARVCTTESGLIPKRVFLFLAKTSDLFECDLRWRRENEIGLQFIDDVPRSMRKQLLNLCALEPFF
jgi:PilZ domain